MSDRYRCPNNWGECKHQPYHHAGEVACNKRIDDYKHMFITQFFEAEDNAHREEEHKEMKIHEKGRPSSRLVFGYESDMVYT